MWLAAHCQKKLSKHVVTSTDVKEHGKAIISQETAGERIPLALRLSGHLLVGVVTIYSRQVGYLYSDANDAVTKIRKAFRAAARAEVDLPEHEQLAKESAITLRAGAAEDSDFSLQDVDVDFGDYADIEAPLGSQHMAEPSEITLATAPEAMEVRKDISAHHNFFCLLFTPSVSLVACACQPGSRWR